MINKKLAIFISFIIIISLLTATIFFTFSNPEEEIKIIDTDGDKIPDEEDLFPDDPTEWYDTDLDGYGDNSDAFPDDPNEWKDSDGDKVGDNSDEFINDPYEHSDLDGDGIGDNKDKNKNVDLGFTINFKKFRVTQRVDLLRWAQIYLILKINSGTNYQDEVKYDNNGKYYNVRLNNDKELDLTYDYDIPDDINLDFSKIQIEMFDYDWFGDDDVVDIDKSASKECIELIFDHKNNSITYSGESIGSQATLWFEIIKNQEQDYEDKTYHKEYEWSFENIVYQISLEIPINDYQNYYNSSVNRIPQNENNIDNAMLRFVTTDDKTIEDLSKKLEDIAKENDFDDITTANFILKFVQETISYTLDEDTKGCIEYWKFPVETLVEKKGDCEDTSVLYAAVMDNLGYDVAILFYTWLEDGKSVGHLSIGVHLEGDHGDYELDRLGKKYYYCETTNIAFNVGNIPPDITVKPERIIKV